VSPPTRQPPHRRKPGYRAFLVHRVSGLALAVFLPAHFWVLALVLQGEAVLDGVLDWTRSPLVKAAETALVVLLAAHLAGGVRLLLIEFTAWRSSYDSLIAVSAGVSVAAGLMFALGLV
jgi:fumarate reductase subunit D